MWDDAYFKGKGHSLIMGHWERPPEARILATHATPPFPVSNDTTTGICHMMFIHNAIVSKN